MTDAQKDTRIEELSTALENVLDLFDDDMPRGYYIDVEVSDEDGAYDVSAQRLPRGSAEVVEAAMQILYNTPDPLEDYE